MNRISAENELCNRDENKFDRNGCDEMEDSICHEGNDCFLGIVMA